MLGKFGISSAAEELSHYQATQARGPSVLGCLECWKGHASLTLELLKRMYVVQKVRSFDYPLKKGPIFLFHSLLFLNKINTWKKAVLKSKNASTILKKLGKPQFSESKVWRKSHHSFIHSGFFSAQSCIVNIVSLFLLHFIALNYIVFY